MGERAAPGDDEEGIADDEPLALDLEAEPETGGDQEGREAEQDPEAGLDEGVEGRVSSFFSGFGEDGIGE